jgi:hypothetical protein
MTAECFNYMAPLGAGFVGLAMERITGKKVTMELRDWSFDNAGPSSDSLRGVLVSSIDEARDNHPQGEGQ